MRTHAYMRAYACLYVCRTIQVPIHAIKALSQQKQASFLYFCRLRASIFHITRNLEFTLTSQALKLWSRETAREDEVRKLLMQSI